MVGAFIIAELAHVLGWYQWLSLPLVVIWWGGQPNPLTYSTILLGLMIDRALVPNPSIAMLLLSYLVIGMANNKSKLRHNYLLLGLGQVIYVTNLRYPLIQAENWQLLIGSVTTSLVLSCAIARLVKPKIGVV